MRSARPKPRWQPPQKPAGPQLVPQLDWTEKKAYKESLRDLERFLYAGRDIERQLIAAAEREAELRYLRRKAAYLERIEAVKGAKG
jgi:hypothetical protein